MQHELEKQYGLMATEILEAISRRFRLRVAIEGAVAQVHFLHIIENLQGIGVINTFEEHDRDDYPDFTIWPHGFNKSLLVECKNVRDEDYRKSGIITSHKVETQKTRASIIDPSSRYYPTTRSDIIAVCLGKKTRNWSDFLFVKSLDLARHSTYQDRLAVMHPVPLLTSLDISPWHRTLEQVIASF